MFDYHEGGERATRDVVSRGIYAEMRKSNIPPNGGVYISMAHLGPENVAQEIQAAWSNAAQIAGLIWPAALSRSCRPPITSWAALSSIPIPAPKWPAFTWPAKTRAAPTAPTALGGNGVANSTVYGGIAGDVMGQISRMGALRPADEDRAGSRDRPRTPSACPSPRQCPRLRRKLQEAMWDDVGVLRTKAGMTRGLARIADIRANWRNRVGVAPDNLAFQSDLA